MPKVIINDPSTNRTAPQQPRQRCPEGLLKYNASPLPQKPREIDPSQCHIIASISQIINSAEGQKLGKSPLDFLWKHLPWFNRVTLLFATRDYPNKENVAEDFHRECDGVPDVLVIIKSGQYIAGGYTEVPFESREFDRQNPSAHFKPNANLSTFVFSANKTKVYSLKEKYKENALNCDKYNGPSFGLSGLKVVGDYRSKGNLDSLHKRFSAFHSENAVEGELFGTDWFTIDEYEVFRLN